MPYKKFWASADTYITSTGPPTGGASVTLDVDSPPSTEERALIKWDLSSIPSNAIVSEAVMTLTNADAGNLSMTVVRCLRDWDNVAATWTAYSSGNAWGSSGAKAAGTDYDATVLATIASGAINTQKTADITSTVQDWIDGTNPNNGLLFFDSGTSLSGQWHSIEAAIKARWPFLEVFYSIPTIGYAVNGTTIAGGILADWPPMRTGQNADATPQLADWYPHRWRIPEMEMSDYLVLQALRGTTLTSVVTTDQATPNVAATYTTAKLLTVTGRQQGRQMLNVDVGFLVKP